MNRRVSLPLVLAAVLPATAVCETRAADPLPVVATEDFEEGAGRWRFLDPESWHVAKAEGGDRLLLHSKPSGYNPPHRSPKHVALLKGPIVTDFELTVRVRSTHPEYPHRDACLFFGYQDAAHFYYVHLGQETDDRCNQIFIVDGADRKKISTKTTAGTPWDGEWHTVRIVRDTGDGRIEVYWDDEPDPVMIAVDDTFVWGQVGVGSFDDTAEFDDVVLRGLAPKPNPSQGDFPARVEQRR